MYSILAAILSIPTAFAAISGAGDTPPAGSSVTFESPFGPHGTVQSVLNNLIDYAILIAGPVATFMVIYGAFQILTAQGNVPKIEAGKKTVRYALVGVAIIAVARLLVSLVSGIVSSL